MLCAISRLVECSLPYYGVTVGITPYSRPVVSQYHRQDNHGQYVYGYATEHSSQDEVKTADGVTRGGYSYIDANGILQTVQYISDPVNGFRVLATNLPRDVPAVAHARAEHLAQVENIKAEHAIIAANNYAKHQHYQHPAALSPVPATGSYVVSVRTPEIIATPVFQPIVVADDSPVPLPTHPVAAVVPVAHDHAAAYVPATISVSSQYQSQDALGQYSYGYADPLSAKTETKTADGITRGGYSYIDANGILQTVQYVSDPVNGFRVKATNLPQAPSVTLIGPKVSTTIVGPKEPTAVIVPAIEQKPILVHTDIVPNANFPVAHPETPYLHSNPNQEPPVIYSDPGLTAPFHPETTPPQYINTQGLAPLPITHSQAVLQNKEQQFIAPGIQYQPQQILLQHQPAHLQEQQAYITQDPNLQAYHEQQQRLSYEQQVNSAQHAGHDTQVQQQAILNQENNQYYGQHPGPENSNLQQVILQQQTNPYNGYEQSGYNPNLQQVIAAQQSHEQAQYEGHFAPQQVLVAPESQNYQHEQTPVQYSQVVPPGHAYGQPQVHGPNEYASYEEVVSPYGQEGKEAAAPEAHYVHGEIFAAPGLADHNQHHTAHQIPLAAGPESQQRADYYAIDSGAINGVPINQQILNHAQAQSAYVGNSNAEKFSLSNVGSALFVPDSGANNAQQVYQQQAPVEHDAQVVAGHEQQQAFVLRAPAGHATQELHASVGEPGKHATAPSGYYSHNIQY